MIRFTVLLLATAALALPVAASAMESPAGLRADGHRLQALAQSYAAQSAGETRAGIRADGLRWQAEAKAYAIGAPRTHRNEIAYMLLTLGALVAAGGAVKVVHLRMRRPVVGSIEHPAQS